MLTSQRKKNKPLTDLKRCIRAIEGICKSRMLVKYYVGFTRLSTRNVKRRYRKWDQLVLLADKMKCKDALDLEACIQEEISEWKEKNHEVYAKYHCDKKGEDGGIIVHRSCGGKKGCKPRCRQQCSVYMIWDEKHYK